MAVTLARDLGHEPRGGGHKLEFRWLGIDRIDDGPAFFIERRNTSGQTLSSGAKIWREALRVDGAIVPETFELGPGLTMDVRPGETWRGILALRQSHSSFYPAVRFGAMVRSGRELAIREGRHTIAVQCGGVWSDDFGFYWEGDQTRPQMAKNRHYTQNAIRGYHQSSLI